MTTALPDWRRAGGAPPARARLRSSPDDFRVTELFEPELDGEGEHDWLWVEKRGANTAWVARRLAERAGVAPRAVGYAGQKDRHAVTRQWFSVHRPAGPADWQAPVADGVTVLASGRHRRKLRHGAHRGNRFEIVLRDLRGAAVDDALARIARDGVPNYFGEQRFGRAGANLRLAENLFAGRRLSRGDRAFALSAARAFLFNAVLDERVAAGTWNRLQPGDRAMLAGSRSHFAVAEVDETLAGRCREMDLHPSGPLWGRAARAGEPALATEAGVAARYPQLAAGLERHADLDRRALRAVVSGLEQELVGDALTLRFDLEPGVYATAVLREIADWESALA